MKRICIYLIYDKQNIVDDYIGYILRELNSCVDCLITVCNMPELICGKDILKENSDIIFFRENIGFDAGGFKEILCSLVGWNTILRYDELILMNDSLFGPFIPMKDIFLKMEDYSVDFWGLASQGTYKCEESRSFPEYIQSYFMVIRSPMLHSNEFRKYWEELPFYNEFWDVVTQHEEKFTAYFSGLGYSYDVLADIGVNNSEINLANNYSQYAMLSYELIKKRNFPFLKKQQIAYNTLDSQTQENLFQAIQYIDKETEYDIELIWDNIIRTLNMSDLQRSLHFQYIITSEKSRQAERYKKIGEKRIAIVIFAAYIEAVEYIVEYLNKLGHEIKYFISVVSEYDDILSEYQKCGINGIKCLDEAIYNLFELSDYDYVCVLHDTDVTSDIKPSCTGKSYFYCIWENLLKDEEHIGGILEKFEEEGRLGFLAPPQPNFAEFFGDLGYGWEGNYEIVERITNELHLKCPISRDLPPFRVTNDFWIRGSILKQLDKLKKEDYRYTPYLWSYFAQDMGYYSGIAESMDYASMNQVNLSYYLKEIISLVRNGYGEVRDFRGLKEKILSGTLKDFCSKYSRILIYGAGYYAKKYMDMLLNVEACVVSDGQRKTEYFEGLPVMYLSEVKGLDQCGIVVCLNRKNQEQVLPIIRKYGVQTYFCIPE